MRFTGATVQKKMPILCAGRVFSSDTALGIDSTDTLSITIWGGTWNPSVSKQIRYMLMYKHHDYLASMNIDTVYHSTTRTSIMNIYGM